MNKYFVVNSVWQLEPIVAHVFKEGSEVECGV